MLWSGDSIKSNIRGLTNFITAIRKCENKIAEKKRVDIELSKIRSKFSQKTISGQHQKKQVWKLLQIQMLGQDVDFGHREAALLINSNKLGEKLTGQISCGMLITEEQSDFMTPVLSSIKNDLKSNDEKIQNICLTMIANMCLSEFAKELGPTVEKIIITSEFTRQLLVKKKAVIALSRLLNKCPELIIEYKLSKIVAALLEERNIGLLLAAATLLRIGMEKEGKDKQTQLVPKIILILNRLAFNKDIPSDYTQYGTPSPWSTARYLQILQKFDPPDNTSSIEEICTIIKHILTKTEVTKSVNKNNADYSVLFEAVGLITKWSEVVDGSVWEQAMGLLGKFISIREPNIRQLGLEQMAKLANYREVSSALVKKHLKTIYLSLKDPDLSIRRRALDLLFGIADKEHAEEIVSHLLEHLEDSAYSMKEELVLKISILAEDFAGDLTWYIDVIITLINVSGNFISDEIWHRLVQVVTGFGESSELNLAAQKQTAEKVQNSLNRPVCHQTMIKLGSTVLPEFGALSNPENSQKQLMVLIKHLHNCNASTKSMIFTSAAKLGCQSEDAKSEAISLYQQQTDHCDPDLQQRANEYLALINCEKEISSMVFEAMPAQNEDMITSNVVLTRLKNMKMTTTDRSSIVQEWKTSTDKPDIEHGDKVEEQHGTKDICNDLL